MAKFVDAIRYDCPACGRRTRINRRTGMIYSHNIPWTTVSGHDILPMGGHIRPRWWPPDSPWMARYLPR